MAGLTTIHELKALLSPADWETFCTFNPTLRDPDLIIGKEGAPYIYRWHLIERNHQANVYFHIQVRDDQDRALHDHPWDNTSVILAGGYIELLSKATDGYERIEEFRRLPGQTVHRRAEWSHRLILPSGVPYAMTVFSTGQTVRAWGFWLKERSGKVVWYPWTDCVTEASDGTSTWNHPRERELA